MFILDAAAGRLPKRIVSEVPVGQVEAAQNYEHAVRYGTGQQVTLLQELLLAVFTQKICHDDVSIPAFRFLVFYSFQQDGTLKLFNNITRITSQLIYAGRATIYNEVMRFVKTPHVSFTE